MGATVRDYAGGIQASPEHLAEVEDRLALLDRLKRKYGPELNNVIQLGEEVGQKIRDVENKDEVLLELKAQLSKAANNYLAAAKTVSRKRKDAAKKLEKLVEQEANDLAMKVAFRIEFAVRTIRTLGRALALMKSHT